jgi:hypothetical protein
LILIGFIVLTPLAAIYLAARFHLVAQDAERPGYRVPLSQFGFHVPFLIGDHYVVVVIHHCLKLMLDPHECLAFDGIATGPGQCVKFRGAVSQIRDDMLSQSIGTDVFEMDGFLALH